jgi:hypothetical protein
VFWIQINESEMQKLCEKEDTDSETYYSVDNKDDPNAFASLTSGSKICEILHLAAGAQVSAQ